MAVRLGVGEALEHEHADALRPADPVGCLGEGLAAPVRSENTLTGELGEDGGRGENGRPAGEGEAALAAPQGLRRQVDRHQRGGAGGVDADRRALEPEGVGDAPGGDAGCAARGEVAFEVSLDPLRVAGDERLAESHEYPCHPLAQGSRVHPRRFQRLPGGLQEQTLLGVHRQRLARGDAEELGVEATGLGEEAAMDAVGGAAVIGVRVIEALGAPAPVGGELADPLPSRGHQAPELLGGADGPRVATGHADDRDRLPPALFHLVDPPLRSIQVGGRALEVVAEPRFVGRFPRLQHGQTRPSF